jgi:hypothetical protein
MTTRCSDITYTPSEATVEVPWGRDTQYVIYDDYIQIVSESSLDFPVRRLICRKINGNHSLPYNTLEVEEGFYEECPNNSGLLDN